MPQGLWDWWRRASQTPRGGLKKNIPILPIGILTFASKSCLPLTLGCFILVPIQEGPNNMWSACVMSKVPWRQTFTCAKWLTEPHSLHGSILGTWNLDNWLDFKMAEQLKHNKASLRERPKKVYQNKNAILCTGLIEEISSLSTQPFLIYLCQ